MCVCAMWHIEHGLFEVYSTDARIKLLFYQLLIFQVIYCCCCFLCVLSCSLIFSCFTLLWLVCEIIPIATALNFWCYFFVCSFCLFLPTVCDMCVAVVIMNGSTYSFAHRRICFLGARPRLAKKKPGSTRSARLDSGANLV